MNILTWPHTPLGPLWAELQGTTLTRLHWGKPPADAHVTTHPAQAALRAYFENGTPLPPAVLGACAPAGGTPFRQRVWQALLTIPHGQTCTYGELAARLNTSPRALGGAVGANPLPVFVPCHRVMGKNGALTGFSAPGGVATKTKLLQHEGVLLSSVEKA